MAVGFRRRLMALTVPKASTSSLLRRRTPLHSKLSYSSRTRSASLPDRRIHPTVTSLHDSATALMHWTEQPAQPASTAWVGDGTARLGRLLAGLTDLLQHPHQAQEQQDPLLHFQGKAAAPWAERLLDDLLLLADAHACFRDALLALKNLLAEARAALRRRDAARLAAALRARRRSDRDLSRLASTMRCLSHSHRISSSSVADSGEAAALTEAVKAATCAAAAASAAIFSGLASASASSAVLASPIAVSPGKVAAVPVWWVADLLRWRRRTAVAVAASEGAKQVPPLEECGDDEEEERQAAMERLRGLEECVVAAEDGCDQVYRALVNARVSLLNVMTPCF